MKKIQITEGPILPNVIRYSVPLILTNLLQLLYNAADIVVVGQFCGSAPLAAVGATGPLVNLLVGLFIGLSAGAGATIAHAIGSKNSDDIKKSIHTSISISLVSGALLTFIGIFFSRPLLILLDTPEEILSSSTLYMQIYFSGMIFNIFCFFAGGVINAKGETQTPLKILSFSGALNVLLNVFFVTVFKMNVDGVALATVLSQVSSATLFALVLIKRNDDCKLIIKEIRFHKRPLLKMLSIGIPSGLQGCLFSLSNTLIQSAINSFGTAAMAGSAAAANLEGFSYTAMNAISQTALTFTGQNLGARKPKRIKKVLFTTCICASLVGILFSLTFLFFGKYLLQIYITDSAEALSFGMQRMIVFGVLYFFCGIQECLSSTNRALGRATGSMVICVFFACVFRILWINTAFLLPELHTFFGLFLSYPLSWILCSISQIILFAVAYKKLTKQISLGY